MRRPARKILDELFTLLYQASITREESRPIRFQVFFIDPRRPDPHPPARIVRDRWGFVRLTRPIPMTLANLRKIAPASDPKSSAFAIYPDGDGKLVIWGLVDQQNRYEDYVNQEKLEGPERPGLFEARVLAPGHIVANIDYEKVADLRINHLQMETLDVFNHGPVCEALWPGINQLNHSLGGNGWEGIAAPLWLSTLRRILLRMQSLQHGGAILITPAPRLAGLNVKYPLKYVRLRKALERYCTAYAEASEASDLIFELHDRQSPALDWGPYFHESVSDIDCRESESELESSTWFVALLSRVDGLVLLSPQLDVLGFGVEITAEKAPRYIEQSFSATASRSRRRRVDYNHFGTRHRSMMRYCDRYPGSVGFVVSQDSDVRVMTRHEGRLVFWENLRLQKEMTREKSKKNRS
ncbi:MAG TPA: hypothetical protein VK395_35175 [Gemmataceae bacterium]|nr:hypothetical protein [Gemmataceae bacterium]